MPKRELNTLTKIRIDAAKPDSFVWDAQVPGFGVRSLPSGRKTFIFQYRSQSRAQGRMIVGHYPAMTVEAARKKARELRVAVDGGRDPSRERQTARDAPTMSQLADYYCGDYARDQGLRLATVKAARGLLDRFVLPRLGGRKVEEIANLDVRRAFGEAKAVAGKYSANKVLAVLKRMFALAEGMEWRTRNPCKGIKKHEEEIRHDYLGQAEVTRLLGACDRYPDQNAADAIRLLLCTGARLREVLKSTWTQFDLDKGLWEKPSSHTKTKRRHKVVLAWFVVELLRQMKTHAVSDVLLFPGLSLNAARVDLKRPWRMICEDAGLHGYRLHDLRRTFATFMLSSGADLSAVGRALGHTQAQTTKRYASLLEDDQRLAADRAVTRIGAQREVA